jgi:hypothetical protein
MHVQEPAIATAAALALHMSRGDVEAVVLMLAGVKDKDEAEDIIMALLLQRDRPLAELRVLALR